MHDALTIAIPPLAVAFAALLNRADVQSLRVELHPFRPEARQDFKDVREELSMVWERIARVEERLGIKSAAG